MSFCKNFACQVAACAAALGALTIMLTGCSSKESEKASTAPPTKQTRIEPDPEPILSGGDVAMLNAGKPATEADKAWEEVSKAFEAPSEPPEWQLKEPTKEEVAAFEKTNAVLIAKA